MNKKKNTPEALRAKLGAKGYQPRVEAAAEFRRIADSIEQGDVDLGIKSPAEQPDLWVKFSLRLSYQNAEQE